MIKNYNKELLIISCLFLFSLFYKSFDEITYEFFITNYHLGKNIHLKNFFINITSLGNSFWYIFFSSITIILYLCAKKITPGFVVNSIKKYYFFCVYILTTIIITGLITQLLKYVIGKPRPRLLEFDHPVDMPISIVEFDFFTTNINFHSFPSGHTSTIFAIGFVLAYFFPKLKYLIFFLASLVAFSRAFIGVHFLTDIFAGAVVGYVGYKISSYIINKYYNENINQKKKGYFILLILIISIVVTVSPPLDLYLSNFFYMGIDAYGNENFFIQKPDILSFFFRKIVLLSIILFIFLVPVLSLIFPRFKSLFFNHRVKLSDVCYLWISISFGILVFVNLIFKNMWGRARPNDILEFGGSLTFTPWYMLTNQCKTNCSFVSGDAALGFSIFAFYFLTKKKIYLFAALSLGSLIGLVRIMEGGHFFSDVYFSGIFIYLFLLLSYLYYSKNFSKIKDAYILIPFFFLIIVKLVSIGGTNLSLYGDEAQYWLWSKELSYGYYSKPPLLSWIIYIFSYFFGNSFFALKMIPGLFYVASSFLVYVLAYKLFNNKKLSFYTSLTFFVLPAVSLSSFLITTDVVLVFFWILGLILVTNIKKSPTKMNFFLLGVVIGLGFLSKYAALYFVLSLILLITIDSSYRSVFLGSIIKFLLTFLGVLFVILPNIVWNYKNNWLTFGHTLDNASLNKMEFNFFSLFEFLLSQIIMIGPFLFIFFLFCIYKKIKFDGNLKFLLSFALPAILIVIIESFLVKANANWAAVSLVTLSILFVSVVYKYNKSLLIINNYINIGIAFLLFGLIGINYSADPFNRVSGYKDLKYFIDANNPNKITNIVTNDRMLFSTLSHEYRKTKINFFFPHNKNSRISNHFQMSNPLPKNFNKNFIMIGSKEEINYVLSDNKNYEIKKITTKKFLFNKQPLTIYEILFD